MEADHHRQLAHRRPIGDKPHSDDVEEETTIAHLQTKAASVLRAGTDLIQASR